MSGGGGTRQKLRVLVAEDSADDYELLLMELVRGGYELVHERVDTRDAMRSALKTQPWDLVVSDWSMPRFSALDALTVLREEGVDVPCIIASGTVGEEVAVEALRNGAVDFVAKDRLARLLPAVVRELREAQARHERDRMKEQLMIADRMASVGMLAAGVAHEINNPLVAVLANLEMAVGEVGELVPESPRGAEVRAMLSDAQEAAMRIRSIVRDLRLFSRADDTTSEAVDVHAVLASSLRMAENEIRHRARLRRELSPVPHVRANESRLGQVFLNLIVNAVQAMPDGRATQNEVKAATWVAPDGRVVVEIADTGTGMEPHVKKRLFTPFFTTKTGEGTGLGLSICHRIISQLGGEITVDSAPGRGSSFKVFLPPIGEDYVPVILEEQPRASYRRSKLLVVDDDLTVAAAIGRMIERDHDVTIVNTAMDALDLIRVGERFDLILSDLMMPEMTGADLHAALLDVAPDQAAAMVFVTGGAFTPNARRFLARVPNRVLEKPFGPDALRDLLSEQLKMPD